MSRPISVSTFHQHFLRCFQNNAPPRIMLALSGGADSMCLAYLLSQCKHKFYPQMHISAVTIDHGFRAESAKEAKNVGSVVQNWGITHSVEKLRYAQDVHSITNFEEVARKLRYDVFRQECIDQEIDALLVAHNKDDQLETFLQRLQMNSTIFGLLGLREKAPIPLTGSSPGHNKVHVYRPLLPFAKADIFKTCENHGVPWFEDLSNQDITLTKRNLLRYMINDYVPRAVASRPELECLSRESLSATTQKIESVLESYESQKRSLDSQVKSRDYTFDEMKAELCFSIPLCDLKRTSQPVMARWLYETVYPLSSAKHFHWTYAKLERQAMPRLWAWLEDPSKALTMTYLNVCFEVQLTGENVKVNLSRQKPQRGVVRDYIIGVCAGDSSWHLFDRIWWLKLENNQRDVHIRYLNISMIPKVLDEFPDLHKITNIQASVGCVPIVLDTRSGCVLAVPTMGLARDGIIVTCKLKAM